MKIACLGCSWTRGIHPNSEPMPDNETYPYHLMKYLGNNNIKADIIQAGRPGAGVNYCHLVADYLIKEFDPDMFVFQITTHDRDILALDPIEEKEKRIRFGFDEVNEGDRSYYKIWDLSDNIIHLSPGLGASASQHHEEKRWEWFIEKVYNDKIKNKVTPHLSLENFRSYISTWYEQQSQTDYQKYFYYSQTYSLIDYLQEKGKDVLPFYWLKHKPEFRSNLFDLRPYPSIEGLFGKNNFKSYQIDEGYHFSSEGNAKLVDDFLGPSVLGTMK
tara:strand:- start:3746 stop:4564 length:819 start_codon:yes stop_codon:yes gene_type:complete